MPQVVSNKTPPGTVTSYSSDTPPTGWLICDGSSLLRADYPKLFDTIGTAFGAADGTHFNIPDLRGRFVRGVDNSAGRDPDVASRTTMNPGGNTGDNIGSIQADMFKQHTHGFRSQGGTSVAYPSIGMADAPNIGPSASAGGNETRPLNAYLHYIIKT